MRRLFQSMILMAFLGAWPSFSGTLFSQTTKPDLDQVLEKAKDEFRFKTDELEVKLILALEQRIESARKSGDKKALDRARGEREKFEADGTLPTMVEKATQLFQRQSVTARKKLELVYRSQIKEYVKRSDDAKADALQLELDELPGGELDKLSQREQIRNGSCEDDLNATTSPRWVATEGMWDRYVQPEIPAHSGARYFWPMSSPVGELVQEIDLTEFAKRIDEAHIKFSFTGYVRSGDTPAADTTRIMLEFLDEKKKRTLATFDSGEIGNKREWQRVSHVQTAIKSTRWVRVRLMSKRYNGTENNSYYDSLSLRLVPAKDDPTDESEK